MTTKYSSISHNEKTNHEQNTSYNMNRNQNTVKEKNIKQVDTHEQLAQEIIRHQHLHV